MRRITMVAVLLAIVGAQVVWAMTGQLQASLGGYEPGYPWSGDTKCSGLFGVALDAGEQASDWGIVFISAPNGIPVPQLIFSGTVFFSTFQFYNFDFDLSTALYNAGWAPGLYGGGDLQLVDLTHGVVLATVGDMWGVSENSSPDGGSHLEYIGG